MTDYRAELQPLFDALNARAALAAEPELVQQTRRVYFDMPSTIAECGGPCSDGGPEACDCGALWRDEPATEDSSAVQAADGEVAELVVCLHRLARADWLSDETADILTRAADLLEQFSRSTSI